jgi:single-strand DNA-binding protein
MASYNKVIMLGNLTRDPELQFTPNQTAICNFGIATNRKWKTQDGTEREEVCFIECTMFGKRGEVIREYFSKGNPILIEGRLTFETWQSEDGNKHSKHKINVANFEFVGGKKNEQPNDESDNIPI